MKISANIFFVLALITLVACNTPNKVIPEPTSIAFHAPMYGVAPNIPTTTITDLSILTSAEDISPQSVTSNNQKYTYSHEFTDGNRFTYTIYDGYVYDSDMQLGTINDLRKGIAEYQNYLDNQRLAQQDLTTQAMMQKPYCAFWVFWCFNNQARKWPNGVVRVDSRAISQNFTSSEAQTIRNALSHADRQLRDITIQYVTNGDRIIFRNLDNGCYANVGYSDHGQVINLQSNNASGIGCIHQEVILHEFGHAIGMLHEHQRPDRDHYITINESNLTNKGLSDVKPKKTYNDVAYISAYDYRSIMHYEAFTSSRDFVKNPNLPMFTGKNGYGGPFGSSEFSPLDIQSINHYY